MFKALDTQSNKEVVILDPKWQQQIGALRDIDRQDFLVCQGCREPVRVRAGDERRHHFSHKHRLNCTLTEESYALKEARAILYNWLRSKYGETVSIEHKIDGLLRPVDCLVDTGMKKFGYWVFDTLLNPDKRLDVKSFFIRSNIQVNYIFSSNMLKLDKDCSNRINLSTTEREFMEPSIYDKIYDRYLNGKSLHYIDTITRKFISFRALELIHPPQGFSGFSINSKLSDMLVSPRNGEFVHPGEYDKYIVYKTSVEQQKREAKEQQARKTNFMKPSPSPSGLNRHTEQQIKPGCHTSSNDHHKSVYRPPESKGICIFCGEETLDWWYYDNSTRKCKCKKCLRSGKH